MKILYEVSYLLVEIKFKTSPFLQLESFLFWQARNQNLFSVETKFYYFNFEQKFKNI